MAKAQGIALVQLSETGDSFAAEIHWYEAPGIGHREIKIKRRLI